MGLTEVPCLRISDLSAAEKRALVIADNKLALNAGWDFELLTSELGALMDLGFDVELTGFDLPEIDLLLSDAAQASPDPTGPEDDHPEPERQAVTRPAIYGCSTATFFCVATRRMAKRWPG